LITLTYTTSTETVALAEPVTLKPGNGVPCVLNFDAPPGGTVNGIQLGLGDDATPRSLLAFLDVGGWTQQSATQWTGTLDCSDSRLATFMSGKNTSQINLQLSIEIGGVTQDYPDLSVTVEPQMFPSSPGSEGGPTYYTESEVNALLTPLSPAAEQSEIDINSAVGSAALFSPTNFANIASKIVASVGSGAYTANYFLPTSGMVRGAIAEVNIELPASSNPTVQIYNGAVSGSPLATVNNTSGVAAYWYGRFRFDGAAWHCLFRAWNV
jgi:hypothetical protein